MERLLIPVAGDPTASSAMLPAYLGTLHLLFLAFTLRIQETPATGAHEDLLKRIFTNIEAELVALESQAGFQAVARRLIEAFPNDIRVFLLGCVDLEETGLWVLRGAWHEPTLAAVWQSLVQAPGTTPWPIALDRMQRASLLSPFVPTKGDQQEPRLFKLLIRSEQQVLLADKAGRGSRLAAVLACLDNQKETQADARRAAALRFDAGTIRLHHAVSVPSEPGQSERALQDLVASEAGPVPISKIHHRHPEVLRGTQLGGFSIGEAAAAVYLHTEPPRRQNEIAVFMTAAKYAVQKNGTPSSHDMNRLLGNASFRVLIEAQAIRGGAALDATRNREMTDAACEELVALYRFLLPYLDDQSWSTITAKLLVFPCIVGPASEIPPDPWITRLHQITGLSDDAPEGHSPTDWASACGQALGQLLSGIERRAGLTEPVWSAAIYSFLARSWPSEPQKAREASFLLVARTLDALMLYDDDPVQSAPDTGREVISKLLEFAWQHATVDSEKALSYWVELLSMAMAHLCLVAGGDVQTPSHVKWMSLLCWIASKSRFPDGKGGQLENDGTFQFNLYRLALARLAWLPYGETAEETREAWFRTLFEVAAPVYILGSQQEETDTAEAMGRLAVSLMLDLAGKTEAPLEKRASWIRLVVTSLETVRKKLDPTETEPRTEFWGTLVGAAIFTALRTDGPVTLPPGERRHWLSSFVSLPLQLVVATVQESTAESKLSHADSFLLHTAIEVLERLGEAQQPPPSEVLREAFEAIESKVSSATGKEQSSKSFWLTAASHAIENLCTYAAPKQNTEDWVARRLRIAQAVEPAAPHEWTNRAEYFAQILAPVALALAFEPASRERGFAYLLRAVDSLQPQDDSQEFREAFPAYLYALLARAEALPPRWEDALRSFLAAIAVPTDDEKGQWRAKLGRRAAFATLHLVTPGQRRPATKIILRFVAAGEDPEKSRRLLFSTCAWVADMGIRHWPEAAREERAKDFLEAVDAVTPGATTDAQELRFRVLAAVTERFLVSESRESPETWILGLRAFVDCWLTRNGSASGSPWANLLSSVLASLMLKQSDGPEGEEPVRALMEWIRHMEIPNEAPRPPFFLRVTSMALARLAFVDQTEKPHLSTALRNLLEHAYFCAKPTGEDAGEMVIRIIAVAVEEATAHPPIEVPAAQRIAAVSLLFDLARQIEAEPRVAMSVLLGLSGDAAVNTAEHGIPDAQQASLEVGRRSVQILTRHIPDALAEIHTQWEKWLKPQLDCLHLDVQPARAYLEQVCPGGSAALEPSGPKRTDVAGAPGSA